MKTLIIFFLMCSVCTSVFAKNIKDKDNKTWEEVVKNKDYSVYIVEPFNIEKDVNGRYKGVIQLNINENVLLDEADSDDVKLTLNNTGLVDKINKKIKEGRNLIHLHAMPAKNDYKHDRDRGSVYYNPEKGNIFNPDKLKVRNYSFHKVVIPDGTILDHINFRQDQPHTDAIKGENLHFIQCNLVNVELDPTWTYEGGIRFHAKWEIEERNGKEYTVQYIEKQGQWVENDADENITE